MVEETAAQIAIILGNPTGAPKGPEEKRGKGHVPFFEHISPKVTQPAETAWPTQYKSHLGFASRECALFKPQEIPQQRPKNKRNADKHHEMTCVLSDIAGYTVLTTCIRTNRRKKPSLLPPLKTALPSRQRRNGRYVRVRRNR
jgi:hypothetical protein